ncbi:MAG TPA: hypothetical protein VI299_00620 [Polyangiales bacterium]
MVRRIPTLFGLVLLLLAVFPPAGLTVGTVSAQKRAPLAVVVGLSLEMHDMSLATLRSIFAGEAATAPDGKRFVPLNAPLKTYERELFDRKVLGLAPDDVSRFWIDRRIRDEFQPPRTLPSAELGVRVVATYPGAITYVSSSIVGRGVRVLRIDGKLPSDSGYLLSEH